MSAHDTLFSVDRSLLLDQSQGNIVISALIKFAWEVFQWFD